MSSRCLVSQRLCQVEGIFYVNDPLEKLMFEELRNACRGGGRMSLSPLRSCLPSPACSVINCSLLFLRCGGVPAGHEANRERGGAAWDHSREWRRLIRTVGGVTTVVHAHTVSPVHRGPSVCQTSTLATGSLSATWRPLI